MKNAYPNYPALDNIKPVYNLNRWVETIRDIYTKVHFGAPREATIQASIRDWNRNEISDFRNWLQYYESGENKKYNLKTAQLYMPENIPGYYLPNHKLPAPITPIKDDTDPIKTVVQPFIEEKISKEDKRRLIEEQRKRIIGRLHAAVKHLTQQEGHELAGNEFDKLLTSLYDLIKSFQTVNKVSLSFQLYADLMIRQANILGNQGFVRSSRFLHKMAQNNIAGGSIANTELPVASQDVGGALSNPTPPAVINNAAQKPSLPGEELAPQAPVDPGAPLPPAPVPPPSSTPSSKKEEKPQLLPTDPLDKFLDNLDTNGLTSDLGFAEDEDTVEINLPQENDIDDEDVIIAEAQEATQPLVSPNPSPKAPLIPGTPAPTAEESSTTEVDADGQENTKIDDLLDQAFAHITVNDLVAKLESVNNIYQQRVLSRELSIIDIMVSKLGLSTYMNEISEIVSKNSESANYISSRLSTLLTMLKGTAEASAPELDLSGGDTQQSPQTQAVQQALQQQQDKEERRKEVRKNIDNEGLDEEAAPASAPVIPATPNLSEVQQAPTPKLV